MKKIISLLLCLLLLFQSAQNIIAGALENVIASNTTEAQSEVLADKYYIPFEAAALTTNASFEVSNNQIILKHGETTYIFDLKSQRVSINNNEKRKLIKPIIFENDAYYVYYDDISFLYQAKKDFYSNFKREVVSSIYNSMYLNDVPGVTFSFIDKEKNYIWEQGFGYSDYENKIPVSKYTNFSLGSISKSFTALTVLKLFEEGKINLDEPILKYVPDFYLKPNPKYGGDSSKITTRMLLGHFSGVGDEYFNGFLTHNEEDKTYMNNLISNISKEYMTEEQGKYFKYSNLGYGILGVLTSKVMGEEDIYNGFSKTANEKVFQPLDMKNTSFIQTEKINETLAKSYDSAFTGKEEKIYVNNISAASLYSNAEDMTKFLEFLLNKGRVKSKQIFKETTLEEMIYGNKFDDGLDNNDNYGLGIQEEYFPDRVYYGHSGNIDYFNSNFKISFDDQLGIFISANAMTSERMINELSSEILDTAIYEKTGMVKAAPINVKEVPKAKVLSVDEIKKYLGMYIGIGEVTLNKDNQILFKDLDLAFSQRKNGGFGDEDFLVFYFDRLSDLDVMLANNFGEKKFFSQRIELKKAEQDFVGWRGYYLPVRQNNNEHDVIKMINLKLENGYPILEIFPSNTEMVSKMYLNKVDDRTYYISGVGQGLGSVLVKSDKEGIKYIKYNGVNYSSKK